MLKSKFVVFWIKAIHVILGESLEIQFLAIFYLDFKKDVDRFWNRKL